jgi:hypothetical protein
VKNYKDKKTFDEYSKSISNIEVSYNARFRTKKEGAIRPPEDKA